MAFVSKDRSYTDNFAILKVGHYINHSQDYSVGLPFYGTDASDNTKYVPIDNNNIPIGLPNETNPYYGKIDLPKSDYILGSDPPMLH